MVNGGFRCNLNPNSVAEFASQCCRSPITDHQPPTINNTRGRPKINFETLKKFRILNYRSLLTHENIGTVFEPFDILRLKVRNAVHQHLDTPANRRFIGVKVLLRIGRLCIGRIILHTANETEINFNRLNQ